MVQSLRKIIILEKEMVASHPKENLEKSKNMSEMAKAAKVESLTKKCKKVREVMAKVKLQRKSKHQRRIHLLFDQVYHQAPYQAVALFLILVVYQVRPHVILVDQYSQVFHRVWYLAMFLVVIRAAHQVLSRVQNRVYCLV
jgi:hypothetical protein